MTRQHIELQETSNPLQHKHFSPRGRGRRFQQLRTNQPMNYNNLPARQQGQGMQPQSGFSTSSFKTKDPCTQCKLVGHSESDCRKKRRGEPQRESAYEASTSSPRKPVGALLVAYMSQEALCNKTWFLDSGATSHVCNSNLAFKSLKYYKTPQFIHIGDNRGLNILGLGTVPLISLDGVCLELKDVLFVPTMVKNLLSVQTLLAINTFCLVFDNTSCTLKDIWSNSIIAHGNLKSGLFEFSMSSELCSRSVLHSSEHSAAIATLSSSTSAQLWHSHLVHLNQMRLKTIPGNQ